MNLYLKMHRHSNENITTVLSIQGEFRLLKIYYCHLEAFVSIIFSVNIHIFETPLKAYEWEVSPACTKVYRKKRAPNIKQKSITLVMVYILLDNYC